MTTGRVSVVSRATIHLLKRCLSAGTATASSVRLPVAAIIGTTVRFACFPVMLMTGGQETG